MWNTNRQSSEGLARERSRSADMTISTETEQRGFVHSALFYHSQREYLDFVTRFVVDGLESGEPVLVAVPGEQLAPLRDALCRVGAGTAALHLTDISEIAR